MTADSRAVSPDRPTYSQAIESPAPTLIERVGRKLERSTVRQESQSSGNAHNSESDTAIDIAALSLNGRWTNDGKPSKVAEQFRLLSRAVISVKESSSNRRLLSDAVMITSTRPGEGKSFVTLNLALELAREGTQVTILDLDTSTGGLSQELGLEGHQGLTEVLAEQKLSIYDAIRKTDYDSLFFLPIGRRDSSRNVLHVGPLKRLVEGITKGQSPGWVLLDTPPVLASSEAAAIAEDVGQVLFVVQVGVTKQSEIGASLDLIGSSSNLRVVLNKSHALFGAEPFGVYYGKR